MTLPIRRPSGARRSIAIGAALLLSAGAVQAAHAQMLGHHRGSQSAPVVIVEFADFACGYCGKWVRETLPVLESEFVETGQVRFVVLPFEIFRSGRDATRAAECAAQQGRFWPMHTILYQRQKDWMGHTDQRERFQRYASEVGLPVAAFEACMQSDVTRPVTEGYTRRAASCTVQGTPTFYINGFRLVGAHPPEVFRQIIAAVKADPSYKPTIPACAAG